MSPALVKHETHTTQQPDGTIVTTKTKTKTIPPTEVFEDTYYEYEDYAWTTFHMEYCCTPPAILRILEIASQLLNFCDTSNLRNLRKYHNLFNFCQDLLSEILKKKMQAHQIFSFIIVACVSSVFGTGPFIGVLFGHTLTLVLAGACICVTFILMVALLLGLHITHLRELPWRKIDLYYSIIAAVLFFVAGCLQIWYATGTWQDCTRQQLMNQRCPTYWPWGVAAAFCWLNTILFSISAWLASKKNEKYFR